MSTILGAVSPVLAAVYLLGTLSQPDRPLMLSAAGTMLAVAGFGWWRADAIARSAARVPLQLTGVLINLSGSVLLGLLDGGVASPLGPLMPLTMIFLAIVTPPGVYARLALLGLLGYGILVWVGAQPPAGYPVSQLLSWGGVAWLCLRYSGALSSLRRRLADASHRDPLTGCLNRRGFDERLEREVAASASGGNPVTLVLIDLDRFKEVNDTLGHRAGDELLVRTGRALADQLRERDTVARLGGDEFAVILSDTGPEQAPAIVDRLRAALDRCAAGSLGHASAPAEATTVDPLRHTADTRLYSDKATRRPSVSAGRSTVQTRPASTPAATGIVSRLERRRHSIANGGWLSVAQGAISMLYVLVFAVGNPYRPVTVLLAGIPLLSGLAVVAGAGWLSRSPAGHWLMLPFTVSSYLSAAAGAWLSGGVASAFGLGLLASMPLIMLTWRVTWASGIVATVSLAYLAIAVLRGAPGGWYVAIHLAGILAVSLACWYQGRTAARHRKLLTRLSRVDGLTGCLNRPGFEERFVAVSQPAHRTSRPAALFLLDLDGFKQLNDTRGHAAGDELLCWVAHTLRDHVDEGFVGRLGGDEFVVLVRERGARNLESTAEGLRAALAERASVSIGGALLDRDGHDFDSLYAHADVHLYEDKARRRATVIAKRPMAELSGGAPLVEQAG